MERPKKQHTAFRLTPDALRLLDLMARAKGLSRAATLEVVIREAAKREGLK
jgi:Ribbon-helix-helix protein, copG family